MALNEKEKKELVILLEKVESTEIKGDIWHQLVKKFITVPIELCILDDDNRIFMVYRKDREFDGYHMPGSVVNDWETVEEAKARLVKGEINDGAGIEITEPISIGWLDSPKDAGPAEPSPRHGVLLLHIAYFHGTFSPREGMGFFPLDNIPENTLGCHKFLVTFLRKYLEDSSPILGK